MTAAEALALAVRQLRAAGIEGAPGDARRLLAHALDLDPSRITLILPEPIMAPEIYFALIERRAAHEPVAKITGQRAFYGRSFRVTQAVLDPRPDTELLVDLALSEPFRRVLDLGTGSGCILLSLLAETPQTTGQGTDISPEALAVAQANAAALDLAARAEFLHGPWFAPATGIFDLVVSNPPYIAAEEMADLSPEVRDWDPEIALTDGADGLTAYRAILDGVSGRLAPSGRLIVEIGWSQGPAVVGLFRDAGLAKVALHTDIDGRDRVVSALNPR